MIFAMIQSRWAVCVTRMGDRATLFDCMQCSIAVLAGGAVEEG